MRGSKKTREELEEEGWEDVKDYFAGCKIFKKGSHF